MTEPDYYKILGVAPSSDITEIRTAYRRRVRDAHPDTGGDPATFHALQEAYEVLCDPQRRLEHDTARGLNRAPWRRGRRTPGRHAKSRKVKAWRVNTNVDKPDPPPGTGEVMPRPWFSDIDPHHRLRCSPSMWRRGTAAATAVAAWTGLSFQLSNHVLHTPIHTAIRSLIIPYALLVAAFVVVACARSVRPTRPTPLIATAVAALALLWWTSASTVGILFVLHLAAAVAVPWTMRRLRLAVQLRAAVRSVLRDYNAFAPGGSRPSADKRTGAVLRALLERLPAARLFVRVPVEGHRAEYTVVCGRRVAVIAPPAPRATGGSDADALPGAVDGVTRLLAGTQVRGFVVWPTLPVERISGSDAVIRHLSASDAAGEIGRWLATDPYTLHLPTLRRLRDRLAAAHSSDTSGTPARPTVEV